MANEPWHLKIRAEFEEELGLDGERLEMALKLWEAYDAIGVARGQTDPPLHEACPRCEDCWRGAEDRKRPADESGIPLPWLGRRYPETRISVAAVNLVGWGGKTAHYWICGNQADALQENRKKGDNSYMGWATASFVGALEVSLRGEQPPVSLPEPREVASYLDGCAFFETIKCSPAGDRGTPTPAMRDNCPDLLTTRELEILRPSTLVLLGAPTRGAVEWAVRPERLPVGRPFARTTIQFSGRAIEVFMVPHPAARGAVWKSAYPLLVESLRARPLTQP